MGKLSLHHARELERQLLIRRRENLIDAETVVDDCRRDVDAAVSRLHDAVITRDIMARELAALVEEIAPWTTAA